jgi:hypothetical protein
MAGSALTIALEAMDSAPFSASLKSLGVILENVSELVPDSLREVRLRSIVDALFDSSDLVICEFVNEPTLRTNKITLRFVPGELYLRVVSTIQRETGACCVFDHGWPILSLGPDKSSVTEPPGIGNCARRGGFA